MSRRPKAPTEKVDLPVDRIWDAATKLFPELDEWWFSIHTCLVSMVPVERRLELLDGSLRGADAPTGLQCALRDLDGEMCGKPADFILVSLFIIPGTDKVGGKRLRYHCAECLYLGMSRAIAHMTGPDFFDASEDMPDGEEKADSMYLVAERAHFLQTQLPRVVTHLKEKNPELLAKLNELIRSGDLDSDPK